MAAIAFAGVRKLFGTREVLSGVDLDVDDGEFVALVGPSGSGKTTLLRILAGLDAATAGEVRIGGRRVNEAPPKARNVAMVFQTYALYPHLCVADNIGFPLALAGAPKAEIAAKVARAAALLGLSDKLLRYPRQLSGGERQRVAMGRAIVREPQAFLFDEPLSNLDARLRLQMRGELAELHRRLATTTLHVTHDQGEAMAIASRVAVLNDGRIAQVGPPVELYDRPANLFVAGFVGTPPMNLLPGSLDVASGAIVMRGSGAAWPTARGTTAGRAWPPRDGAPVVLGVRPEHVVLGEGIAARVRLIEPAGADTRVVLTLGDCEVTALPRDRPLLRPGEIVPIAFAAVHLFDAASGLRLDTQPSPVLC